VRGLAGSRFEWERTMADLARALPSDVHLRTLVGGTTSSATSSTSSISAPTIQLTGCTVSQTAVAQLMSRLRNVRGVSRVALTNSAKAADVAGPSAGAGTEAQLCPKGSPPDFDVTMYFERATKPAGATVNADGTTTTTATASTSVPATDPSGTAAVTATPAAGATTTTTTSASAK
jgi:hypothetical protein